MEIKPPKAVLYLWQLRALALCTLLYLLISFIGFKYSALIFLIFALFSFVYLPLFLRGYRICDNGENIILHYGVFIKHRRAVKRDNIIYCTLISLPDAAAVSLCAVIIRGVNTRIFIPELELSKVKGLLWENYHD